MRGEPETIHPSKASMRTADLHLHTIHSDGIRTPQEVIALADAHRLDIVSISDHDNVAAWFEVRDEARARGITLIPGAELSAQYEGQDIHILAYAFDPFDEAFARRLSDFREVRNSRGAAIVDQLRHLGISIELARVRELAGEAAIGRPHVARVLVELGAVTSIAEAFDTLLGPGCPAWVDKARFTIAEAVDLVRAAGGVTSIAHPTVYDEHERIVPEILALGVDGVEASHPSIPPEWSAHYERLARSEGKIATGGSDDHGFEERCSIGSVRVDEQAITVILERFEALRLPG